MNALIVGSDKTPILRYLPSRFLLIDDGPLIDRITLPARRALTVFDVAKHAFNPLRAMDYRKAREFIDVLDGTFPEGENTLTRKNSNFVLLNALLSGQRRLDTLTHPCAGASKEGFLDASQKIQTLLLSPVLKRVLTGPTNFSFKGTIFARLNRAELGDFDCFILANLLVSQYQGTVVIPDFGFYACPFHVSLIRQQRLVAGINSFSDIPTLKHHLMLIDTKIGSHCTPDDAEILALYAGIPRDTNAYSDFIQARIRPFQP